MTETRAQPKVISCEEYGHVVIDPLSLLGDGHELIIDSDVHGRDAFTVDFVKGKMRLRASSLVGVIPLNEQVVLKVRPRVPIANLTRMVQVTGEDPEVLRAFRDYQGSGTASEWIMDLYAEALLDHVDEILHRGIYREYVRRDSEGSFPHGRVDFNRTISRHAARGVNHKASFYWFERTSDTAPNRCIKAALLRVHAHLTRGQQTRGYREMVNRLAGQLAAFSEVAHDRHMQFLQDREVLGTTALPEARDYYRHALDLALMVVQDRGLALEPGLSAREEVRLPSLLIEMNSLFESYVRISLQREAEARGWSTEVIDGNKAGHVPLYVRPPTLPSPSGTPMEPAFEGQGARATPDLVFRMGDGSVGLVAEVKNTAKRGVLPERNEVNQAVTYAVRYGLDRTVLIRPFKEGRAGLTYCGDIGGIHVYDYKINLGSSDLEAVVSDFADAMGSLLPETAPDSAAQPMAG